MTDTVYWTELPDGTTLQSFDVPAIGSNAKIVSVNNDDDATFGVYITVDDYGGTVGDTRLVKLDRDTGAVLWTSASSLAGFIPFPSDHISPGGQDSNQMDFRWAFKRDSDGLIRIIGRAYDTAVTPFAAVQWDTTLHDGVDVDFSTLYVVSGGNTARYAAAPLGGGGGVSWYLLIGQDPGGDWVVWATGGSAHDTVRITAPGWSIFRPVFGMYDDIGVGGTPGWLYGTGTDLRHLRPDGSHVLFAAGSETVRAVSESAILRGDDTALSTSDIHSGGEVPKGSLTLPFSLGNLTFCGDASGEIFGSANPTDHYRMYFLQPAGVAPPPPPPPPPVASGGSWGSHLEVSTTNESRGPSGVRTTFSSADRPNHLIHQDKSIWVRETPALIVAGMAVEEPMMAGISVTDGIITAPNVHDELEAALDVNLGATWRWLPGDSFEASGGGFAWHTSQGAAHDWTNADATTSPYVDPAFELPTRHGEIIVPALIFDGEAFMQLGVAHQPQFTVAIVARLLHSPISGYYDILASPSAATDPVKGTDLTMRYRGSRLLGVIDDHRYADVELEMWSRGSVYGSGIRNRPVIIVWSCNHSYSRFGVLDALTQTVTVKRISAADLPAATFDLNFFLGRGGASYSPDYTAHMQVFDVAVWRDGALGPAAIRSVMHKLNGVYGVHR